MSTTRKNDSQNSERSTSLSVTPWIQTFLGKRLSTEWEQDAITLEETAAVLSRICRFGARTRPVSSIYSVAQHSVYVWQYVQKQGGSLLEQWSALNHEGDEALLGFDPPAPWLRVLPDLRALKHSAHVAYCRRYGLPEVLPPIVKHADLVLLATEKRDLMLPEPEPWIKLPEPDTTPIKPWSYNHAREAFIDTWRSLAKNIGFTGRP